MFDNGHYSKLADGFKGRLFRPEDREYDDVRQIHNGMVDKRPALIARCRGVADVVASVRFARETGLEISVRGGGHNVAGRAVTDGGVMIDLADMKGMHVDPRHRIALAQAGLNWGEFNRETQLHGLATTGGAISTTGIAGLTLGGGIGYLMGKYGLTADNLLSVQMVTAEARVLRAAADENEDLFWGVRGGGGNFGIVTGFSYQLHQVGPQITGGLIAFPFDEARKVLRFFRDFTASLPDEIVVFGGLVHAPDGSGVKLAVIIPCHCGPLADGQAALAPLKSFSTPALDGVGPMAYEAINAMLDPGFPKGALNYWKSNFLRELTDEVIDALIERFSTCPSKMSGLLLEHFHGAATRIGPTETAFPHRQPGYNLAVISEWIDPAETGANISWTRETYDRLAKHFASWSYVNYMEEDASEARVRSAYGPNFERLRQLKKRYDPDNVFHLNQNIRPD